MKDFFKKHRHLIAIAMVLAVILAALTPSLMRLGFKLDAKILYWPGFQAEDYSGARVLCAQHYERGPTHYFDYVTEFSDGEMEALLQTFRAIRPEQRVHSAQEPNRWLATFRLNEKDGDNPNYEVFYAEGVYLLRGRSNTGSYAYWQLSEQDAERLLVFCRCENHGGADAQKRLCDPEQVVSVTLTQRVEEANTWALSASQIETLCAYLKVHLLSREMIKHFAYGVTLPRDSWSANITLTDGSTYRLMYRSMGQYRLLLGIVPEDESAPDRWLAAELEEENPFAAVPQLLEDIAQ